MDRVELLNFIRASFNDDELRELCFTLKINYEDLSGENRSATARELVAYCERHDRLAELESTAQKLENEYMSGQRIRPAAGTKSANISGGVNTSGGVNISGGTTNIYGDVTGRDKLTSGAAATTPTLRATPPAPPAHFTGREADLDRFTRLLTSGQHVAITALHGMGGIGKTSLALKLAEQIGRAESETRPYFPGGVLWWSLGPNPDVITALDVWARHADPRADLTALPTAEARAEIVRPMLANLGKLCVIIDDVWDADSFNVLRSAVPAGCSLLMTTRDADLAKSLRCRVERIDALSDDEAVALLEKLLGPLNEHADAACDIAHLTDGLPLALELIAGLADSPADLPSLAQRLKDKSPVEVLKRGTTREQSIEMCFTLSYDHLDADLRQRFYALGVFALAPFDRDAIAAVWAEDGEVVDQSISQLVRRSLLSRVILSRETAKNPDATDETLRSAPTAHAQRDTFAEYTQHALLHDYALKLLKAETKPSPGAARPPSPSEGEAARQRVGEGTYAARHADYYRRFAETQDWREIEHTFDQIEHGWQWVQANATDQILDYVFAVQRFLDTRGRKLELLNWYQIGLAQARTIKDRENEGTLLNNLGSVYDDLGQKDKALDFYQHALGIRREVGDRSGEGATLNNLGRVYDALGQKDKALDFYQQALGVRREVGDRSGEGTTLNNLGLVYYALGQKDKALDFYQQALGICREVGDRSGEGTTLNNLGRVYNTLGQPDTALDYYGQALAIHREVGNRPMEGTTLNNLGSVYDALGEADKALDYLQQALAIQREVGNRWMESVTLFNIGMVLDAMGRTAEAISYLEQNVALDEAIGHPDLESDRAELERVRKKLDKT
jgi:tetratricopeptide (TPR) repeat protein